MASNIDKVLKNSGRPVQITLYEELPGVFTRISEWAQTDGKKPDLSQLEEPLWKLAAELVDRQVDTTVENIRKGRAQAAVAYISLSQQAGLKVNEGLGGSIRTWREGERAKPVQQILDEALRKLPR